MIVCGVRRMATLVMLCGSVALTGCATAARAVFTQPDVTFRGVGLRSLSVDGADLEVLLNIYNPNAYSLGASALHYRLLVDSLELGAGAIDSAFSVAKRDSAVVRLPVRLGFRASAPRPAVAARRRSAVPPDGRRYLEVIRGHLHPRVQRDGPIRCLQGPQAVTDVHLTNRSRRFFIEVYHRA